MSRRFGVALTLSAWLLVAVSACATHTGISSRPARDCIADFRAGTDYFPDKSTVLDATNFTLSYHDSYQVLTVKQPYPRARPDSYVLVRCGAPAPELSGELARAQRITVPIASMYSASITQLAMLTELNRADVVTGVADPADVVDPQLRQRITSGKTVGYAPGRQVNVERVIAAHPDVLVTSGTDEPGYPKLRDARVEVVADAEWLEATPLGRAEWIKVLAALTGTEKKAPLWLVASDWKTVGDVLAADNRYGELAAVRTGRVWSATKAVGPGGGNDYWERGTARPDLVLGDLVAILHPELAPNHEFTFYRQVVRA